MEILQGWNAQSIELPWETEEETNLRIDEEDVLSNSALTKQAIKFAGKKQAPVWKLSTYLIP
jgi:hypothetical protein